MRLAFKFIIKPTWDIPSGEDAPCLRGTECKDKYDRYNGTYIRIEEIVTYVAAKSVTQPGKFAVSAVCEEDYVSSEPLKKVGYLHEVMSGYDTLAEAEQDAVEMCDLTTLLRNGQKAVYEMIQKEGLAE